MQITKKLVRKSDNEEANMIEVDELLCQYLNVPCDPDNFHNNWRYNVGMRLAAGASLQEQISGIEELIKFVELLQVDSILVELRHQLKILNWLNDNFTVHTWIIKGD